MFILLFIITIYLLDPVFRYDVTASVAVSILYTICWVWLIIRARYKRRTLWLYMFLWGFCAYTLMPSLDNLLNGRFLNAIMNGRFVDPLGLHWFTPYFSLIIVKIPRLAANLILFGIVFGMCGLIIYFLIKSRHLRKIRKTIL